MTETSGNESQKAVVEQDLDAAPDEVWEAITTDEGLERWMGRGARVEAVPGGELEVPDIASGTPHRGRVDEVEPDRRISWEWWPADRPEQRTSVEIELEPLGPGTRVRVIESAPVLDQTIWAWRGACLAVATASLGCA